MKKEKVDLFSCLTEIEKKQGKLRGTISAAIENKRHELGMTQKEFACMLNITQGMVSKFESSGYNISIDSLVELFEELDIKYNIEIENKACINNSKATFNGTEYKFSDVAQASQSFKIVYFNNSHNNKVIA